MDKQFLEEETLKRRKLDLMYYEKERLKENYLLKYKNRSESQAERYADRKIKAKLKEIDNRLDFINSVIEVIEV